MKELKYSSIKNDYISDACYNVATCLLHSHTNFSVFFTLKCIKIFSFTLLTRSDTVHCKPAAQQIRRCITCSNCDKPRNIKS